jgi:serine/threonine-protein kinase HipA
MSVKPVRGLGVHLETPGGERIRVGGLVRHADDTVRFDVDESYIALGPSRPVLSSAWVAPGDEEKTVARLLDRRDKRALFGMLPPWFKNLLPEGALRALVESQMPTGHAADFDVLEWLGRDLPGAVIVLSESGSSGGVPDEEDAQLPDGVRVRFSLAGIQLKLSMLKRDESLTLPARGTAGEIIAKLPSEKLPHLPEVEYSSMVLAAAAGVAVPSFELIPVSAVRGVPKKLLSAGPNVLAVRRFDRADDRRVHVEDFAQILGAVDDQKYARANDETILKMAGMFSERGVPAVMEAASRMAVNILLGNTDAHLKNWSFIYPDGRHALLSPAYDIVAVYVYDSSDMMALKFQGTRSADLMGLAKFQRAAGYAGAAPNAVTKHVRATVERAADTWPALLRDLPMPDEFKQQLRERWSRLALSKDIGAVLRSPS